ncbi:MAG: IS21 family transposase [Deltaproteobacteria bacterium]|nr:IS21 family transposase [Deltaproteobacteria bacterium]
MVDKRTIFEIHRLANEGLSIRKIAKSLQLSRKTVSKYLTEPNPQKATITRASKLDPFKDEIDRMLQIHAKVSAVVIRQRLLELGFDGGTTIVRDYLQKVRGSVKKKRPFIRFESAPGQQCQIDWGHFGSLSYGNTNRKLYCLALVECYSRMLYLEFTHCQRQQTLHRALLNAFRFLQGAPKELVHDNMLTAVIERHGPLVRFNEAFLEFLRPFKIVPIACNVARPHEKGKVEKGAIHYIRYNFWPLRTFKDLKDIQTQANHWRDQVANQRIHATTGDRPIERFNSEAMTALPEHLPDCRDTKLAKVHTDFSIRFDGNAYTVPPWAIGKQVVAKADHHSLTIYLKDKAIATHPRCWQRKARIELPQHREAARKHHHRHWLSAEIAAFISLGEVAKSYLENLAATKQSLKKHVRKLLELKDEYGAHALEEAMKRADSHNAYGAHYIENILYQEMTPQRNHPPVRLKQDELNRIRLDEPCLAEYDAFVLKGRKKP